MFSFFKKDSKNTVSSLSGSQKGKNEADLMSCLSKELQKNISSLNQFVGVSGDIVIRKLKLSVGKEIDAAIIYVEGIVDNIAINDAIIRPLLAESLSKKIELAIDKNFIDAIGNEVITNLKLEQNDRWDIVLDMLFSGDTVLLIDGYSTALIMGTRKWNDRGVEEPTSEPVVMGPRDGFSETLKTSIMLIRRRIKSYKLRMEFMKIGTISKTDVTISYVDGIVNPKLVEEVKKRLNRIEVDSIIGTKMLEEFIEDSSFSPIPQILTTERPDKTAAHLLEGGVAILVDGSPLAMLLPIVFWKFLFSTEDYYDRVYASFLLRFLRVTAFVLALTLPAFYIAVTSFHHEMIPNNLLQIIAVGRTNVPFPIFVEVLIMEIVIEILREGAARLPKNFGNTISIVGALVLGQAGIQAKLASPATVTVVAITQLSNFTIPNYSTAISVSVVRFLMIIASGVLGVFGFIIMSFIIMVYLCSLRSFGVPFLAPLAPLIPGDLKDTLIRMPSWFQSRRPQIFGAINSVRQKSGLKPGANQGGE